MTEILLATRNSPLALEQARRVRAALLEADPFRTVALVPMTTTGDQRQAWSLEEKGGKGLFTKELEEALFKGRADAAIHSAKDLPTSFEEGLCLRGYLPRGPVGDVLVLREGVETPTALATGSPRRRAQLRALFPGVFFHELRGNVATRLRKIAAGEADGTVLAAAGLQRLGIGEWPGLVFRPLSIDEMVPAVGQGAIAIQTTTTSEIDLEGVADARTAEAVTIERAFLRQLGGGCQTAFGGHWDPPHFYAFHEEYGRRVFDLGEGDGEVLAQQLKAEVERWMQSEGGPASKSG